MKFGSVCSGIESASIAWEPLGFKAAWFAEIEAFPSAVLAHHWPEVANFGDMCVLPYLVSQGLVEAPDILVGGTPCQAFSVAGLRKGLGDERGQLTLKFVELANEIDNKRPGDECVVVWENVPGVLSSKDNAFGCFLGALAGEDEPLQPAGPRWSNAGCVYGPQRAVAWRVLDAQYFGVAQRRRRVFVVASSRTDIDPAAVLFERESMRRDTPPRRSQAQDAAQDVGASFTASSYGQYQPGVGSLRSQGGDIGGASETIVAIHPHCIGRSATAGPQGKEYLEDGAAYTLDARGAAQAVACTVALRGREGGATAELGGEVATALRASTGGGDKPHILTVHGTQDPCVSDSTAFALGRNNGGENAVYAFAQNSRDEVRLMDGGIVGALAAQPGMKQACYVNEGLAVRRLTPVECERLQGFDDNHTRIPWRGKAAEDCPDGPRYKAIGNSKAVPVIRFVGARIQQELNK